MTFNERKAWLERYGKEKRKIEYLRLRREEIETLYQPHSALGSLGRKSNGKSTGLESYAAAVDDIDRQTQAAADKAEEVLSEIYEAVEVLADPMQMDIILQIYVQGIGIKQFSMEKGYSKRQAQRIHDKAILSMDTA